MKKILFVDDEPKILQGLQRMLHSLRHEWDMKFVTRGQEALEALAKDPFDVVVTDMRMPGMDGAQLLKEVMKRYPRVVRVILSGQTNQECFLSSAGIVHQFLSKPCDAELLKTTIERACAMQDLLKNESLKQIVMQTESLPSQSDLYVEIIEALQSPSVSMEKVGAIISKDIGMTAKVLQIVNSAFYGVRRRISNPAEAAIILGLNTIKALALSYGLFSRFDHVKIPGFSLDMLWRHSMLVGSFAKQIAKSENCSAEVIDNACVAGMLHDIGKLVLAAHLPGQYKEMLTLMREKNVPLWEAEQEILRGTHADVGAYLIGLWGISDPIVEAIAYHHSPAKCLAKTFAVVTAVHVANVLGSEVYPDENAMGTRVDSPYIAALGLTERLPVWGALCKGMAEKDTANG